MYTPNNLNIQLASVGKKFGTEWIFSGINLSIEASKKLVILGGNGSGKSTLLQVISGYVLPNKGKVIYHKGELPFENSLMKDHVSLAAPYIDVIEEFSLPELIEHCALYKPFLKDIDKKNFLDISELAYTKEKAIRLFSSGMKQRVKLALAILADCEVLLLDEPSSNLDKNAIAWYKKTISEYASHKTIIVCSNSVKDEFEFCEMELDLANYKLSPAGGSVSA